MTTRIRPYDFALVLLIAVVFLIAFRQYPGTAAYQYDEADYVAAGSKGFTANYLEKPSLTILDFLQAGLHRGKATERKNLSEWIRSSGDVTFYRHFHGPIYFYWVSLAGPLSRYNEYATRYSGFVFHVLTFAVIYFGMLTLVRGAPRIAALIASFLYLFSSSNLGTAAQITPHIPYVLFTVATLFCFARFLVSGNRLWWYIALVVCAFAFASIEYAILLPISFALCLYLFRKEVRLAERGERVRVALRSIGIFGIVLLVLWPVGLLELSMVKSYFYIGYLALQRKGSFGDDPFYVIWMRRMLASPVEYLVGGICALTAAFRLRRMANARLTAPFLIYGVLMLLTTLKNTSLNPTYVSSILPCLAVISGIVLSEAFRRLPRMAAATATAVILVLAAGAGVQNLRAQIVRNADGNSVDPLVQALQHSDVQPVTMIVPYEFVPTISYYFPNMRIHPYLPTDDARSILETLKQGGYQAVLYFGKPGEEVPATLEKTYHVQPQRLGGAPAERQLLLFRLT